MKTPQHGYCRQSFLNGREAIEISAYSRGLYYGHGVFETLRVTDSQVPLWDLHIKRLRQGASKLGLALASDSLLEQYRDQCLASAPSDCVLKIVVMAGEGGRGYAAPEFMVTDHLFQTFPLPEKISFKQTGLRMWLCQQRLSCVPELAGIKHLNRLEQILARAEEKPQDYPEGLMIDRQGNVIEAISSNMFCLRKDQWLTPKLEECGVAGVMREYLLSCHPVEEAVVSLVELSEMEEIFVCNAVRGIQPVTAIDSVGKWPVGTQTRQWQQQLAREFPCFDC